MNLLRPFEGKFHTLFNILCGVEIRFKQNFLIHNQQNAFMYSRMDDNASSAVPGRCKMKTNNSEKIYFDFNQ